MFKYFIVYTDGNVLGNSEITIDSKIESYEDILQIQKLLTKQLKLGREIIITDYKPFF